MSPQRGRNRLALCVKRRATQSTELNLSGMSLLVRKITKNGSALALRLCFVNTFRQICPMPLFH